MSLDAVRQKVAAVVGRELEQALAEPNPVISGATRGARPLLLGLLAGSVALWIAPTRETAERLYEDATLFAGDVRVLLFPEKDGGFDEGANDAGRLAVLEALASQQRVLVVASLKACLSPTPPPQGLLKARLTLKQGETVDVDALLARLVENGYTRTDMVERRGEFSRRGCILDAYPATGEPARLELWGDTIDSMRGLNLDTQRSGPPRDQLVILPMHDQAIARTEAWLLDYLPREAGIVVDEPAVHKLQAQELAEDVGDAGWEQMQLELSRRRVISVNSWGDERAASFHFDTGPPPAYAGNMKDFVSDVQARTQAGETVVIASQQSARLTEVLEEEGVSGVTIERIAANEGFVWQKLVFLTDREIVGTTRRRRSAGGGEKRSTLRLEDLTPGDFVVHVQHGVGIFRGVEQRELEGRRRDLVHLEYARGDGLYVPVEQMDLVQKYVAADGSAPGLSRLGGQDWARTRRKARENAQEVAQELLRIYAERHSRPGHAFSPDTHWQDELEAAFPFEETPDQEQAIGDVKADMETPRPMDRLVCGDAGFGKTEVALRAAFKAVMDGYQVAVLVPTTILAQQHYQTIRERLAAFPVKVGVLSRFRTPKEQRDVLDAVTEGNMDVVVGTHRLLSSDVKFKKLGLVVVDEEQHFGVLHKEKLRKLCATVDTITLTATPIPRTLHMAMSGARDLSIIRTPPEDRLPIKTYLLERSPEVVAAAIIRELGREGQVYFLHNRVHGIQKHAAEIKKLVPKARVAVGHGQMAEEELERIMMEFMNGEYDVLVCTTIIESGLDISNANTIIINDAHTLGLAQLYQLRGRVGRGHRQAYAYLLYPPTRALTEQAERRLETIREFTQVGSGLQIALRDLEIRGAGNLLGAEQSGFIADVGFDLYMQLLSEAVSALKGEKAAPRRESGPVIDLPLDAFIPGDYVGHHKQKVTLYKRLAAAETLREAQGIAEEMRDRYGPLPEAVQNLVRVVQVKILAMQVGAPSVKTYQHSVLFAAPFAGELDRKQLGEVFRASGIQALYRDYQVVLMDILRHRDWPERLIAAMQKVSTFQS
ncbi:MAG: transcription-repair coupling factor [Candidatus Xenobia bacterium]